MFIVHNLNVLVYIHSVCRLSIELKPKIFKKKFREVTNLKRPKTREIGIFKLRKMKRFERKTKIII